MGTPLRARCAPPGRASAERALYLLACQLRSAPTREELTVDGSLYPVKAFPAKQHVGRAIGEADDDVGVVEVVQDGILHCELYAELSPTACRHSRTRSHLVQVGVEDAKGQLDLFGR